MRAYLSDTGPQPRLEAPAVGDTNPVPLQSLSPAPEAPTADRSSGVAGTAPAASSHVSPGAGASTHEPTPDDGGAVPVRQAGDAARTAAISFDPESMPDEAAASPVADAAAARAEKAAEAAPAGPRDGGLWGKISNLAERAAGHRDRDSDEFDADRRADDDRRSVERPRTGGTGVTGVVDGLPRDDEPTTWPFPRR